MPQRPAKARARPRQRVNARPLAVPPRPVGGWDVARLVAVIGGPEALRAAHAEFGFRPLTPSQISNWSTRYTIPSNRLAELFVTMQSAIGATFNPLDYIKLATAK